MLFFANFTYSIACECNITWLAWDSAVVRRTGNARIARRGWIQAVLECSWSDPRGTGCGAHEEGIDTLDVLARRLVDTGTVPG